ncbi:MAG: hypothetical protein AAF229_01145 [Pseudomonadota bacterium]
MRDGWLDEPLKPLLRVSAMRRWREGRQEAKVLRQAAKVFVTSEVWQDLLSRRYRRCQDKISILTNAYPPTSIVPQSVADAQDSDSGLVLVHAGRFTGSRLTQRPKILLEPLLLAIGDSGLSGRALLLGSLTSLDLEDVDALVRRFQRHDWDIDVQAAVPREDMMNILGQCQGLLLLSASHAALPSKLFEYLLFRKPILAVTHEKSALWQVSRSISNVFLVDYRNPASRPVREFLSACSEATSYAEPPDQFSETFLGERFAAEISSL